MAKKYLTKESKSLNRTERTLLDAFPFIQPIIEEKEIKGYRLYTKGVFGLPSFSNYYWIKRGNINQIKKG